MQSKTSRVEGECLASKFWASGNMKLIKKLAQDKLMDNFDYDQSKEISFCESCAKGKHHRSRFPTIGGQWLKEPLGLVMDNRARELDRKRAWADDAKRVTPEVMSRKIYIFIRFSSSDDKTSKELSLQFIVTFVSYHLLVVIVQSVC